MFDKASFLAVLSLDVQDLHFYKPVLGSKKDVVFDVLWCTIAFAVSGIIGQILTHKCDVLQPTDAPSQP